MSPASFGDVIWQLRCPCRQALELFVVDGLILGEVRDEFRDLQRLLLQPGDAPRRQNYAHHVLDGARCIPRRYVREGGNVEVVMQSGTIFENNPLLK